MSLSCRVRKLYTVEVLLKLEDRQLIKQKVNEQIVFITEDYGKYNITEND